MNSHKGRLSNVGVIVAIICSNCESMNAVLETGMHIVDYGLELDREIRRSEAEISELVESVLDALKECKDTMDLDRQIFDLHMHLLDLRIRRACVYGVRPKNATHYA